MLKGGCYGLLVFLIISSIILTIQVDEIKELKKEIEIQRHNIQILEYSNRTYKGYLDDKVKEDTLINITEVNNGKSNNGCK